MNKEKFIEKFNAHIKEKYGTGVNAAFHYGVSSAFISGIKSGNKQPTQKILDDMGLEKVTEVRYVKKRKG